MNEFLEHPHVQAVREIRIKCRHLCIASPRSTIFSLSKSGMMRFEDFQYKLPKMKKQMFVMFGYD